MTVPFRKMAGRLAIILLPLGLSGCAIPDAVAHLTKKIEDVHDANAAKSASPASAPAYADSQPASAAPDPVAAPRAKGPEPAPPKATKRPTVTVQPLN